MGENQRIRLTKKILRQALLQLMEEKTLQNISVTELCKAAEINRATFYKYYAIPEDILQEMAEQVTSEIKSLAPKDVESYFDGTYLTSICYYLLQKKDELRPLIKANTDSKLEELFIELTQYFWEVSPYLNQHGFQGKEERLLVSTMVSSGCYQMVRMWLIEDIKKTPEEIAALATRVFFKNIHMWIE